MRGSCSLVQRLHPLPGSPHEDPRMLRALIPVILALAGISTAATATVIDSFTDPLPSNPLLPVSGQAILFLGPVCDGASCPPASSVSNVNGYDYVEQSGLPGIPAGSRRTGVSS